MMSTVSVSGLDATVPESLSLVGSDGSIGNMTHYDVTECTMVLLPVSMCSNLQIFTPRSKLVLSLPLCSPSSTYTPMKVGRWKVIHNVSCHSLLHTTSLPSLATLGAVPMRIDEAGVID